MLELFSGENAKKERDSGKSGLCLLPGRHYCAKSRIEGMVREVELCGVFLGVLM